MNHFFPTPAEAYECELLERVARSNGSSQLDALTPERLRTLTIENGCDFTTALLHRRIVESDRHAPFLRALDGKPPLHRKRHVRVAIVPGAFYRENPRTGADGRLPREAAEKFGFEVLVAPVSSTGALVENARILEQWITSLGDATLILVSLSKGGSDVKTALARPGAVGVFQHVIGWVNLCGILDGTPMADWLLSESLLARVNRFVYRIRGRSLAFLADLRRYPQCPLSFSLVLPAHMRAVHVVGFPLKRHLRNGLARRCHARLEQFGPNDGSIILSDVTRWPGQLCPVWGADHYLRPREDVRPLLAAILCSFAP